MIYVSERDGWRHLYLIDAKTGTVKNPITQGAYVVRGIDQIDEAKRQVWFRASGKNPEQDPYFVHYYRVNFDGTGSGRAHRGQRQPHGPVFSGSPVPDRHLQPGGHGSGPRAAAHGRRQARVQARAGRHRGARGQRLAAAGGVRGQGPRRQDGHLGHHLPAQGLRPAQEVSGHRADLRRARRARSCRRRSARAAGSHS